MSSRIEADAHRPDIVRLSLDAGRAAQATGTPPDRDALLDLAAEHGMDIVGPA